jgi:plasmid stability protein
MKETHIMKQESIQTTVDIPAPLYRKLKERAAARGHSVRELILAGVRSVLVEGQRPRPQKVRFPLIVSKGQKVNVTNERIYEHVEFP